MKKINVVLVGVGHDHAHDAFLYITSSDSFDLLGIVLDENDNGNYLKWKEDYDKYKHYTVDEVLLNNNVDAVVVESGDTTLTKYATIFASKGLPVHMDKPGSQDKESFDKLIDICRENNAPLHLGYMYRYNPSIKKALEICRSGLVGEIYSVEAHMSINLSKEKRVWLNNFEGGMMNYLGCHLVDLVVSLLGKPDEVTPYLSKSSNDVGIDMALAVFKYKDKYSHINTSGIEFDGFSRRHITICAEKMTIDISPTEIIKDGELHSVSIYKAPVVVEGVPIGEVTYGPTHRYKSMFEEFASIVRKEKDNPYTLEHEQLVHDILLKACGK